ncbi:hypothetical protein VCHA29O37_140007 [Vibrio chagasii]|nr:hypothetical protein VCHA29O37_140007 [Vibrio chagasii]
MNDKNLINQPNLDFGLITLTDNCPCDLKSYEALFTTKE